MTKRAKFLCLTAAASTALVVQFVARAEDDLDWIRRYGPTEKVMYGAPGNFGNRTFNSRWHRFSFKAIPPDFVEELASRTEYHKVGDSYHFNGTFPDTDRIMLEPESNSVLVWMHEKENLLAIGQRKLRGLVCLR